MATLSFDILARDRASKVFDQVAAKSSRTEQNLSRVGSTSNAVFGKMTSAVGGLAVGWQAWDKVMVGGFNRLANLDDARKRLDQMGVSTTDAAKLMDGLTETVTGTAFSLDAGANAMTGFVSAGVDLDEVNDRLQMTADTAAFAQAPLDEIGNIFVKIQSQGKLTAEELNMLQERGVPALVLLADAAGVTAEAMRDMISKGQIDAERFFQLWEQGSQGFGENNIKIEGAAKSMGDTIRGSLANAETALARVGAEIIERFLPTIDALADGTKSAADAFIEVSEGLSTFNAKAEETVEKVAGQELDKGFFDEMSWNTATLGLYGVVTGLKDLVAGTDEAKGATDEFVGGVSRFDSSAWTAKGSTEALAGAAGTAAEAVDGVSTSMEYAEQVAKNARDAIEGLKDSLFATGEAALALDERQDALAEAVDRAKEAADGHTKANRDERGALRGVAEQAHSLIQTMVEQEASTKDVRAATESARAKFVQVARQMGLTKSQANALADEYGLIPDDVATQVRLIGAKQARADADRVASALSRIRSRVVTVTINEVVQRIYRNDPQSRGFVPEFHSGGVIGMPRAHSGMYFGGGLRPDERIVVGQTGERILSRRGTRALHELVSSMGKAAPAAAGRAAPSGMGMDSRRFARDFVDEMQRRGMVMARLDVARYADLFARGG